MRLKTIVFFILIIADLSCRKSNYIPPATPVIPDSLLSWKIIGNISGNPLSDIWFTTATRGFTLSDKIYQTNDGGITWTGIQTTSSMGYLSNLFFVNSQFGFAQDSSQLAITVDGGNSWTVKKLGSDSGQTIFFVDPLIGFYGDEGSGGLKKTTDAGNSWTTIFSDPGTPVDYYPYFLNVDTGFVATGSGSFASTYNGGQIWQTRTGILPANQYFQSYNQLFFVDKNSGFYACQSGVMKTIDGGQSWQHVLLDSLDGTFLNTVNVIRFLDSNTGYYKGLTAIYKSSDGGQTWSLNCKLGSDYFIGMYFLDIHTGWACTNKGRILRIQQ
jgi:photosystem II stability/assembly factor-like uncharacterized protein